MFNSPWTILFVMSVIFMQNFKKRVLFPVKWDWDPLLTTLYMYGTQSHNIMFLICSCLFFEEFLLILCLLVKEDTTCDHDGTDSTKDTDFITKHQHWQPNQKCPLHCIEYTKTTNILKSWENSQQVIFVASLVLVSSWNDIWAWGMSREIP